MLIYVFDGSFEGLLSAIYLSNARKERPDQYLEQQGLSINFLDRYFTVETNPEQADKVASAIRSRISELAFHQVMQVFLSEHPERGSMIDRYIRLGFKLGPSVDDHLHEDSVLSVQQLTLRVSRESHRMKGLLRFIRSNWGIYYAKYSPVYNTTSLLAPHFADRLADQPWIIHDTGRGIAAVYDLKEWILTDSVPATLDSWTDKDDIVQEIWRTYHHHIAITERTNPRLQKSMMPMRYWKDLTEFQSVTSV